MGASHLAEPGDSSLKRKLVKRLVPERIRVGARRFMQKRNILRRNQVPGLADAPHGDENTRALRGEALGSP
jgi:hypothetical protein